MNPTTKKRRVDGDIASLYSNFAQAAAAVSSLYAAGVQAERRGRRASLVSGSRVRLMADAACGCNSRLPHTCSLYLLQERVASWVLKEYGTNGAVPTAQLLAFLQAEMAAAAAPGPDAAAAAASGLPMLGLCGPQPEVSDAASDMGDEDMGERRSPHKQQMLQQQQQQQQMCMSAQQGSLHHSMFGGPPPMLG